MAGRYAARALIFSILFALFAVGLNAQTSKGTIAGTVTDASGAVVTGATVTAKDTVGGEVRTVTTGNNGEFRIEAISPSKYDITVVSKGFATSKVNGLDVRASVVTSLNPQLQLSGASDTIEVNASTDTLNTESAELSHSVSALEIQEIPIASVNPIELALTEPGVVRVSSRDSFTNGVGFSVDGLRPRANNFLIDGFDNNDNGIGGQAIQPQNTEAVKEVVVQTNSYSAEFGRGGGSVTNVIYAGGTNQWHGGIWERYSGSSFNAITSEQASSGFTDVPRVNNNYYGFKLGGPIVHNKLFVFGSAQWNPIRGLEQGSQITIPTAAGLATLQSLNNQNAQILISSLGGLVAPTTVPENLSTVSIGNRAGCGANCTVQFGTFSRQAPQIADAHEYVVRTDYVASDKDTVSARFLGSYSALTPDLFANPNALPGVDTSQGGPSRNLGIFWTHVLNERAVNEVRFNVQTLNFGFDPTAAALSNPFGSLPDIELLNSMPGVDFGGIAVGFPQDRDHTVYQYQEAFSYTAGHHSMKMGGDITHLGISDGTPFNFRGSINYNPGGSCAAIGLATCTDLANFLDDFSGNNGVATKQFGSAQITYPLTQMAFYFQDDWKLRPNLSFNYGLRYEFQGTPFNALSFPSVNEKTVLTDNFLTPVKERPDKNNFGPRAGIAYTPRFWKGLFGENKTVIRAGAGVFYDALFSNILNNTASSTPNVSGGTTFGVSDPAVNNGRGDANFSQVIPNIIPGTISPTDAITTAVSNLRNPLTYQWNLNVERELPGNWFATVAYVGTRGERLWLNAELNPKVEGVRLNPNRGSILARTNHGDSIYHGLQLKAEHNFSHGLLFRSAYTWSRAIDNGSEVFTTSGGTTRTQDLRNPGSDRGPSAFDRKHRLVLTWVYQLPGVGGGSGFGRTMGLITKGWQFAGTSVFESGAPETIYLGGFDVNRDGSAFNDRPTIGNLSVPLNFSSACAADPTCITGLGFSTDGGATYTDLNTGAPGAASAFRYLFIQGQNGKVGRNSFYNPGRQEWVMAVQREFKLPMKHLEQQSLQLRLEAFNPFNHPNLGGGENGVPSVSGNLFDPNFQNTSITRVGGRSIRLFAKYSF
jgi:hypothetical protein